MVAGRSTPARERGAALLIVLTILVLGAATLLVGQLNQLGFRFKDAQTSDRALLAAKEALLGWSLGYEQRPGLLPVPDLAGDGNYDGDSDCPAGPPGSAHQLGRLPWRSYLDAPPAAYCSSSRGGVGAQLKDAAAEPLWYAVSANLLYSGSYPVINADSASLGSGWLTVRDGSGAVLSNRVAAVVLAPGRVLAGQDRSGAAAAAANYLDSVVVGGVSYSNADGDLDFIAAAAGETFNDRLLYITIDELLAQVERKVVATARACLERYGQASGGRYPWAAPLDGSAPPSYVGVINRHFGRIPAIPNIEIAPGVDDASMSGSWQPADCFSALSYWPDWRESIFYQVAAGFAPGSGAACPACLTLGGQGSYHAVVVLAGRALASQVRLSAADKGDVANYLEAENGDGDSDFVQQPASALFNDRLLCLDGGNLCR